VFPAIVAALKTGRIYVALDAYHSPVRLAGIVADATVSLIVCDAEHRDRAKEIAPAGCAVLCADEVDGAGPSGPLDLAISARALAAICYTSGSTGEAKGILWDHRGITHRAWLNVNVARVSPDDRMALLQSVAVGSSFRRIFGTLLGGAALLPFDLRAERADALAPWMAAERITLCAFAASVFRHFAAGLAGRGRLPDVRIVWIASETVLRSDVALFRERFAPPCVLATGLSTSETGPFCDLVIDEGTALDDAVVPVGYPLPDKEVLLLDDGGGRVGPGEVGEIAVRSEFVAMGHWRRPDLDARKWERDPAGGPARIWRTGDLGRLRPDGCLVHLGRKDAQAKLRGRFVDTREIESALLEHPGLTGAVVSIREDRLGDPRLVAYVVGGMAAPSVGELHRFARQRLDDHLVPSTFVCLDALPRTPNGKVDRQALPAPGHARPALTVPYAPPTTPAEEAVARIWAEALGLDAVGIHDEFLDLGGTSLVAAHIAAKVCQRFAVELSVPALLAAPGVAEMAAVVVSHLLHTMGPAARDRLLASLDAPDRPETKAF
jgi:acyl-coenzyme A synthetase/AMP-(fatty) acid ligase